MKMEGLLLELVSVAHPLWFLFPPFAPPSFTSRAAFCRKRAT